MVGQDQLATCGSRFSANSGMNLAKATSLNLSTKVAIGCVLYPILTYCAQVVLMPLAGLVGPLAEAVFLPIVILIPVAPVVAVLVSGFRLLAGTKDRVAMTAVFIFGLGQVLLMLFLVYALSTMSFMM